MHLYFTIYSVKDFFTSSVWQELAKTLDGLVGKVLDMAKCPQIAWTAYPVPTFEYWFEGAFTKVVPFTSTIIEKNSWIFHFYCRVVCFWTIQTFTKQSRTINFFGRTKSVFFSLKVQDFGRFWEHVQDMSNVLSCGHRTSPTKFDGETALLFFLLTLGPAAIVIVFSIGANFLLVYLDCQFPREGNLVQNVLTIASAYLVFSTAMYSHTLLVLWL